MFKIAFGLSLILAVLKMIDVINCSWLMVLFPMLVVIGIIIVLCVLSALGIYLSSKNKDKQGTRRIVKK